jgi:hypothetical protein
MTGSMIKSLGLKEKDLLMKIDELENETHQLNLRINEVMKDRDTIKTQLHDA